MNVMELLSMLPMVADPPSTDGLVNVFFNFQNFNAYLTPTKPISSPSFSQNFIKLAETTVFKYTEASSWWNFEFLSFRPFLTPFVKKNAFKFYPYFMVFGLLLRSYQSKPL